MPVNIKSYLIYYTTKGYIKGYMYPNAFYESSFSKSEALEPQGGKPGGFNKRFMFA